MGVLASGPPLLYEHGHHVYLTTFGVAVLFVILACVLSAALR